MNLKHWVFNLNLWVFNSNFATMGSFLTYGLSLLWDFTLELVVGSNLFWSLVKNCLRKKDIAWSFLREYFLLILMDLSRSKSQRHWTIMVSLQYEWMDPVNVNWDSWDWGTLVWVPQGSVLSSVLFKIYIKIQGERGHPTVWGEISAICLWYLILRHHFGQEKDGVNTLNQYLNAGKTNLDQAPLKWINCL